MKKGFTLVELLIVIIIIGILATMAMPQYQKMVNRARWTECITLANSLKTGQNLYYAENNAYATNINQIDGRYIDLPSTTTTPAQRKFRFNLATTNMIYGWYSTAADDSAVGTNNFYINLTSNATGYNGSAPGIL